MTLPTPPRPTDPIPNNPFYSPVEWGLAGPQGPLVVGTGLFVSDIGVLSATGVVAGVADIIAGSGISVNQPNGVVTVTNTGVLSLAAGSNITLSDNTGDIIISAPPAPIQTIAGVSPISVTGGTNPVVSILRASAANVGAVQLFNGLTSTSQILALTAAQGKILQDQISALSIGSSNLILAGILDASTGLLTSVTNAGSAVGFGVGGPLPPPDPGNESYFVIVEIDGYYTPPGGTVVYATRGDWFLSTGTAWTFLNVGFDPTQASETAAGVVRLATDAETETGTDSTIAVTPDGLQNKVSDDVTLSSSNSIASSLAVKTAYDIAAAAVPCDVFLSQGSLLSASGPFTPSILLPGSDGQVLTVNSAAPEGLSWVNGGTVELINTGTGLTGGPITALGTISLANTAVVPGDYLFPSLTIDAQGRIINADSSLQPITCKDFNSKGDLLVGTGLDSYSALPLGSDTQVLTADTNCPRGIKWGFPCQGTVTNILTGTGLTGGPITTNGQIALANTTVVPGTYTNVNLTVDQQGRITNAESGPAPGSAVLEVCAGGGLVSDPAAGITECGTICLPLQTSNGFYTNICNITVDQYGRITGVSPAAKPIVENVFSGCGQLVTRNALGCTTALGRGTEGQVLTVCDTALTGLVWASPAAAPSQLWVESSCPASRLLSSVCGFTCRPTFTSVSTDVACYRQLGSKLWEVGWFIKKTEDGGTDKGCGQYLFRLPPEVPNIDTSICFQKIEQGFCDTNSSGSACTLDYVAIMPTSGTVRYSNSTGLTILPSVWATRCLRIAADDTDDPGFLSSNYYAASGTTSIYYMFSVTYQSV